MNNGTHLSVAQRTCGQCKSSKKKCDKLQPKCSRCQRLSIDCVYIEQERHNGSDIGNDGADARFEEIFERLQTIEARLFSNTATDPQLKDPETDLAERAKAQNLENPNREDWATNPVALKPQHMSFSLTASLLRLLRERDTTITAIAKKYFDHTGRWLPIIPRAKFEKFQALSKTLDTPASWILLVLAMHLLVAPLSEHPPGTSLEESPIYRICKNHFAQYVALEKPCIELVQAGMLIALFEYLQCIGERAFVTIGISARLAYILELDEVVAKQSKYSPGEMSAQDEEVVLTWWGLSRLERYFNMPPLPFPKPPCIPSKLYNNRVNHGRMTQGPPTTGFSIIDSDTLEECVFELEAAHKLGEIQGFIRDNRDLEAAATNDGVQLLLKDIQEKMMMNKINVQSGGSYAGILVTLGAGIQLQGYIAEVQRGANADMIRSLYSHVAQVRDIVDHCRIIQGFTEDYLEGVQPTWCSVPYQALRISKMLRSVRHHHTLPDVDTTVLEEILKTLARRYKLAEKCLQLLDAM